MATKKGLAGRFKGSSCIKVGGVYCYCCNSYKGASKPVPGRQERRKAKMALKAGDE